MPQHASERCVGPDLVIAGAARSGTSVLAAQLGRHSGIDPGVTKEPSFFSRHFDRGTGWYDGLFEPRSGTLLRLDASTSYTSPYYPQALPRLSAAAPHAAVVYLVRDPIARAFSQYLLRRYSFHNEPAPDFGAALRDNELYAGASDYSRWLRAIYDGYPREKVLVIPFRALTDGDQSVVAAVCSIAGLSPAEATGEESRAFRNQVVEYRTGLLRAATRTLRKSRVYPAVRRHAGAQRIRRLRSLITRQVSTPTVEDGLASCDPGQLRTLSQLETRSREYVARCLQEQDGRTGLGWLDHWLRETSVSRLPADGHGIG